MNKLSLLSVRDLSVHEILQILQEARIFNSSQKDWHLPAVNALVANLFFEPSTRTHFSFESAEFQLGCKVADFSASSSSVTKGESLYDTARTFEAIGYKVLVIRHPDDRYYERLRDITIPILNAGDGAGDHPTQCLLDLYTMWEEFGSFEGLKVVICGDIKHSRVAASNKEALDRLGADVRFAGPAQWRREGYPVMDFDQAVEWADVVMMLRIQKERGAMADMPNREYLTRYGLTMERASRMKPGAIIMHPAPVNRDVEIDSRLVEAPQSRIFRQMTNGVLIRKAVLKRAFGYPPFREETGDRGQSRTADKQNRDHIKVKKGTE